MKWINPVTVTDYRTFNPVNETKGMHTLVDGGPFIVYHPAKMTMPLPDVSKRMITKQQFTKQRITWN